jgi:hypothetical protein
MINISAIGLQGTDGTAGLDAPALPQAGPAGRDADCGFFDDNEPTNGIPGTRGLDGGWGVAASAGGSAGAVTISVDEYRGGIEIDAKGGGGGIGGRGGNGAQVSRVATADVVATARLTVGVAVVVTVVEVDLFRYFSNPIQAVVTHPSSTSRVALVV